MPGLSISEFADKVGELMPVIMRNFMRHQTEEFYKLKITMPQFFVMEYLRDCGQCRMSDIAKFIKVTTAGMTGIIDRLVRDGYVLRSSDPRDRRIVKIRLTAKGLRVVRNMVERRKQVSIKMFGMISQKDRDQYLEILTKIKDKIQDQG